MLLALRQSRGALAQCLLVLALLGASAQAWTPPGLMLTQGEDGEIVMALCSGNGPTRMWLDPETGKWSHEAPGDPQSVETGADCNPTAFAAATLPPSTETHLAPLALTGARQPRPLERFAAHPPTGPPPARAPPLSA